MKSDSYKQADCCTDQDCDFLDYHPDEPCWGQVHVTGEFCTEDDSFWEHACEGHVDAWYGRPYIKEPIAE